VSRTRIALKKFEKARGEEVSINCRMRARRLAKHHRRENALNFTGVRNFVCPPARRQCRANRGHEDQRRSEKAGFAHRSHVDWHRRMLKSRWGGREKRNLLRIFQHSILIE